MLIAMAEKEYCKIILIHNSYKKLKHFGIKLIKDVEVLYHVNKDIKEIEI